MLSAIEVVGCSKSYIDKALPPFQRERLFGSMSPSVCDLRNIRKRAEFPIDFGPEHKARFDSSHVLGTVGPGEKVRTASRPERPNGSQNDASGTRTAATAAPH